MDRKLIVTEDGSHTILIPEMGEHYHSVHGAIQESRHIFIENGYAMVQTGEISILELGFGTGLNALLTLMESISDKKIVTYEAWDAYPLPENEYTLLNYPDLLGCDPGIFLNLHQTAWGTGVTVSPGFTLKKVRKDFLDFKSERKYDLVYFDAFGPDYQPELWEYPIFKKIFDHMSTPARLVTYSAKGQVRRNLRRAGFEIIKLPGPPGKREMTAALKKNFPS